MSEENTKSFINVLVESLVLFFFSINDLVKRLLIKRFKLKVKPVTNNYLFYTNNYLFYAMNELISILRRILYFNFAFNISF